MIITQGPPGDVPFDPNNPIVGGIELDRPESPELPFSPHVPDSIGRPLKIQMTPPKMVPRSHMELDLVYADSDFGQFVLAEQLTNGTAAINEFKSFANERPGCFSLPPDEEGPRVECHLGDREVIEVDGRTVLLLQGKSDLSMTWVEPASDLSADVAGEFVNPMLEVDVVGYGMDRKMALDLARQFS